MKKSIKSVAFLSMGLVLGSSVLAGCSLVTPNYEKYYNAVAARVEFEDGSKIEITRKELRTAYASYGFSQYVEQGLSQEEAYTKALDFLVAKKLAIRDAEIRAKSQNPNNEILTSKEKQYLFESTAEGMFSNIDSYLTKTDSQNDETKSESAVTREVFERKASLKYDEAKDEYSIVLPESQKSEINSHVFWSDGTYDASTEQGRENIYSRMLDYIKDDSVKKDSFNKYLSAIKESEKNLNLSKDAKSVFMREIERVYGVVYDSFMVNKYTEFMTSETTNNVVIQSMLDLYSSKVRSDYVTYHNADQAEAIKNDSGGIYYFENGVDWFYVSHILIKFDETTKRAEFNGRTEQEQYDYLNSELDKVKNGEESDFESTEEIQSQIDALYTNLIGLKRKETDINVYEEDSDVSKSERNAGYILENVVKPAISGQATAQEKAKKFDDLIYVYNEDPGMLNATYNYVVGVDYTKPSTIDDEVVGYSVYSNWVSEFNKTAVSLYNNGNGEVGDLYDGLIRSNYGVHIMMYAGKAGNLYTNINSRFTLQTSDIVTLWNAKVKAGSEKTYFDVIYEECVPETSSIFEALDRDRLTGEAKDINYFRDAF